MSGKTQNAPTLVELVQQLKAELWRHAAADPAFAALIAEGHAANDLPDDDPSRVERLRAAAMAIGTYLVVLLEADGCVIDHAHAILHGDDNQDRWDHVSNTFVLSLKYLHIHVVIKFKDRVGSALLPKLAALCGVPGEQLELPNSRGGSPVEVDGYILSQAHDNMLAYLVHAKYPTKYQYLPSQVATVRGVDYMAVYVARWDAWMAGRAAVAKKVVAASKDDVLRRVRYGEISRTQMELTDALYEVYGLHKAEVDEAFALFGQRRARQAAVDLKAGRFRTQILFFAGISGTGKSYRAEGFIDQLIAQREQAGEGRWEVFDGATTNVMDDWQGEEIVFLDEARATAMNAADWLLLLNPYRASPAAARYKNKPKVAPRVIIITAPIDPWTYFLMVRQKGGLDEAMDQFIRRLSMLVTTHPRDDDLDLPSDNYWVSEIGSVPKYVHPIRYESTGHVIREDVPMRYGLLNTAVHSQEGLTSRLLLDTARRSPDVPFASCPGWDEVEAVAHREVTAYRLASLEAENTRLRAEAAERLALQAAAPNTAA